MTCKDCIHSGLCYMENDFNDFPDKCGNFINITEVFSFERVQELVKLNQQLAQEIENLKRPQGEWKHDKFDEHYCNKCFHYALWSEEPDGYYEVQSNFCPNCGVDMRKGDVG